MEMVVESEISVV